MGKHTLIVMVFMGVGNALSHNTSCKAIADHRYASSVFRCVARSIGQKLMVSIVSVNNDNGSYQSA